VPPPSSGQIMQSSARRAPDQWKSETMQIAGAGPVPEFGMRFIRGRVAAPARILRVRARTGGRGGVGGGEEYIQIRRAEIRIRIGGVSSDTCLRIGDDH